LLLYQNSWILELSLYKRLATIPGQEIERERLRYETFFTFFVDYPRVALW